MERIRLTRNEKVVLRLTAMGKQCPAEYPEHLYVAAVRSLEHRQLVKAVWAEETKKPIHAMLTPYGEAYLTQNPALLNPINWAAISAIGTAIAVVVAVIALVVACNKY